MLDKRILEEILGIAASTGADFAEVYCELTRNGNISLLDGKIDAITDNTISGVGIRAFLGTKTVYGSTSDISREGLIQCAKSVAAAMGDRHAPQNVVLTERIFPNIHPVRVVPSTAAMKTKTDLLREACTAANGSPAVLSGRDPGTGHYFHYPQPRSEPQLCQLQRTDGRVLFHPSVVDAV